MIALVKNSYVDPHFHELPNQWEMFFILEGEIDLEHYSTDGTLVSKKRFAMDGENIAIQIDPKEVHGLRCISDRALLLEIKEGPFKEEYAKTFL